MSRWTSYLDRASEFLAEYQPGEPAGPDLKAFFRERPQMGSTDRRTVTDLVYGFFRMGKALQSWAPADRALLGLFLSNRAPRPMLEAMRPAWVQGMEFDIPGKIHLLSDPFQAADLFPWMAALSGNVEPGPFAWSHLRQPEVYIRVRPGREDVVRKSLVSSGIAFRNVSGALALAPGTALQQRLEVNRDYVVQDLNSQKVGSLMSEAFAALGAGSRTDQPEVWDCCAASGGKAILAKDLCPEARLTVSDIRPAILDNLSIRMRAAGVPIAQSFVADLSRPIELSEPFDLVIADLPCSGSGTWSRNPEQLYGFDEAGLGRYPARQKAILRNVWAAVRPGGFLLLVTCSVFRVENEDNADFLASLGAVEVHRRLFAGYSDRADTLFAGLFRKGQ